MGQRYRQFSVEERIEISRLHAEGVSIRQIATSLDRAPSSVARELKRNSGVQVGYKPIYAQEQARARRWSGSRLDRDAVLRHQVLTQLGRAGLPSRSPDDPTKLSAPKPSTASSTPRLLVTTTSTGGTICPAPSSSEGGVPAEAAVRRCI